MAGLMACDGFLLFGGCDLRAFLKTADNAVYGIDEVLTLNVGLVVTGGDKGRLIADVGDIGAGESGCLTGQKVYVDALVGLDAFEMYVEYSHAVGELGKLHVNLAVEAACTQECLVEDVGAVGGREDDYAGVCAETVHFGKELVEGVFALVVGSHVGVLAAGTAYSVDFVDEHYAGSFLLCFLEEVANARCAHTDKHFYEVGARHGEERHVGLAGHSLGQEGLTRSRRAYKKGSFWNLAAEIGVALRILEEFHNLLDFGFSLGKAGHVGEGHFHGVVLVEYLSLRFPYGEYSSGTAVAIVHTPHKEEPEADEQKYGAERPDKRRDVGAVLIGYGACVDARIMPFVNFFGEVVDRRHRGAYVIFLSGHYLLHTEYFLCERIADKRRGRAAFLVDDYLFDVAVSNRGRVCEMLLERSVVHAFRYGLVVHEIHSGQKQDNQHIHPVDAEFYLRLAQIGLGGGCCHGFSELFGGNG